MLASELDIDSAVEAELISMNWREEFPWRSSPYTSTIVFLVRAQNPKSIRDWSDLSRNGVDVVATHPDVSGAGRLAYLAVWHAGSTLTNNPESFAERVYSQALLLRMGARQAVSAFTRMPEGDVLLTWENEALRAVEESGTGAFKVVYPKESILAEPVVAIVDRYVKLRGSRAAAERFVYLLFSEEGQQIAARNHLRPRAAGFEAQRHLPALKFFTVPQAYGSWEEANRLHFSPNGTCHRVLAGIRPSTFEVP